MAARTARQGHSTGPKRCLNTTQHGGVGAGAGARADHACGGSTVHGLALTRRRLSCTKHPSASRSSVSRQKLAAVSYAIHRAARSVRTSSSAVAARKSASQMRLPSRSSASVRSRIRRRPRTALSPVIRSSTGFARVRSSAGSRRRLDLGMLLILPRIPRSSPRGGHFEIPLREDARRDALAACILAPYLLARVRLAPRDEGKIGDVTWGLSLCPPRHSLLSFRCVHRDLLPDIQGLNLPRFARRVHAAVMASPSAARGLQRQTLERSLN